MAKSSRAVHRGKATESRSSKKQRESVSGPKHETRQDVKSERKIPSHVGFQKGDPRINRTIPGPGRPPGKFARRCRKILASKKTWKAVRRVIQNPDNPMMKGMWSEVANRGHGRVSSEMALTLPPQGNDDEGNPISPTILLIGKLDAMEKRKVKAQEKK